MKRGSRRPASVVLTGAASGIGRALAIRYGEVAERLLLIDRERADETAAEITASHDARVELVSLDIRDPDALWSEISDFAAGEPLDRVLHAAGVLAPTRALADVDPGDVQRVVDVNLVGSFNVARAALPHLVAGSHLAVVSSLAGLVAGYRYAAYSASKFGVVGLAEVLRMELAPLGVRMQVICPGEVQTPMIEEELASGDEVQRAVKLLSGPPISADVAAQRIFGGVESGRFMVIPTSRARMVWRAGRWTPTTLRHAVTDRQIRQAGRRSASN